MDNSINPNINIRASQINPSKPAEAEQQPAQQNFPTSEIDLNSNPNALLGRSMVTPKQNIETQPLSPEQKKQEQIERLAIALNDKDIAEDIVENCFEDEYIKKKLLENPELLAGFYDTYKAKYCHGDKRGDRLGNWETCYLIEELAQECGGRLKDYHLDNYKLLNNEYDMQEKNFNDILKYLNDDNNEIPKLIFQHYEDVKNPYLIRNILKNCVNSQISNTVSSLMKDVSETDLSNISAFLFENSEKAEEFVSLIQSNVALNSKLEKIVEELPKEALQNILKNLEKIKQKYNSKSFLFPISDKDTIITMMDDIGHVFRFDSSTGSLVSIVVNNTVINPELGTNITSRSTTKQDPLFKAVGKSQDVPDFREIVINKQNGKEVSTETLKESPVKGEYEIWQTYPDGSKDLIGLAEYDQYGGKHVEKTLTALDGSKTHYVYADDKDGNRFLHYNITDKDGNITFKSEKKFKVLSDNHYQTSKNNEHYDIEIKDDKIITTKLNSDKEKTDEVVEYKIVDFSDDDYQKIYENFNGIDEITITEALKNAGYGNIVDRKLLPLLKQLSGDEWFALNKNTEYIIRHKTEPLGAFAGINCIVVGDKISENGFLATIEHEIGHEKFVHLKLNEDTELQKIYNEERANFISSFPQENINSIGYFLNDNEYGLRGLNETCAETNQIINIPQTFDGIKDRTIILQQFFPKTLAYIANKFDNL